MWTDDLPHHNDNTTARGSLERPRDDLNRAASQSLLSLVLKTMTRNQPDGHQGVCPAPPVVTTGILDETNGIHDPAFDRMMIRFGGNGF